MDIKKTIAIAITGNIFTDQRMIKIANDLQTNNYNISFFYRPILKYKNTENFHKLEAYNFKIYALKIWINTGILFYLFYNFTLFKKLIFKNIDVFYAVDSDTLLAFTALSKIKNKPLIYDAHEYFAEVPELENQGIKQKIWHWITQWGVNQSKIRFTVSHSLALALQTKYGKPFKTIRNVPLKVNQETQKTNSNKPIILYQGALNKGREIELLIKAMQYLPHFDCVIIGEGDISQELRDLSKNLALENIVFKGLMSPNDITQYTTDAYVGFNLLDAKSKSYYYSLSNKYFDYMQAGIPSISSKLPEYEQLNVELNCGICIKNNVDELVKIITHLKEDKITYQLMCENAILASNIYHWENESKKLINLLKTID